MAELKSSVPAVMPVTLASAPSICPKVAGTISSRSSASAAFERSSVPSPAIGIEMWPAWLGLVSMLGGPSRSLSRRAARPLRWPPGPARAHVVGLDNHVGRDLVAGEGGLDLGRRCASLSSSRGSVSSPGSAVFMPTTGSGQRPASGRRCQSRTQRAPQHAVHDRSTTRATPPVPRLIPAAEGHAALVHAVAELGQQGRQHRERADHRPRPPPGSCRSRTS